MKKQHLYSVYILANKKNATLYTGEKNNLIRRVVKHKKKLIKGFTSKYNVDKLIDLEPFTYADKSIQI